MNDYSEIIGSIKTTEDRDRLYSEIELVSEAMYKEGEFENVLNSQISKDFLDHIGGQTSAGVLSQKLSDLKKVLDSLTVVKLTLAFEPSESATNRIIAFIRQNLSEKTILEIRQEPSILGGLIFEFKGLYRDYALKTKLDELFNTKREEILNPKH